MAGVWKEEKANDALDGIKKDITYMPLELKKKLEEENISFKIIFCMTQKFLLNKANFQWEESNKEYASLSNIIKLMGYI